MKRLLIIALTLVALTATVSAQELSPNYLGIKGGLTYTKIYGDEVEDVDYYTGFAVGAFYQYELNPRFAISPEFYYSTRGAKESTFDINVKLGYVDIPVLLKLMFPTDGPARPAVYAGGYYSFLVSAEMEEIDIKEIVSGSDYGLVFGGSVDIMLKEGKQLVNFDVRYIYGLANINDDPEDPGDVMNSGFQFLIGWGFNL
jgi:hypothetical protein